MYQTQPKYKQKNTLFIVSTSTGKERDSETGFSYFGARYYDSDILTGWLSVDPMADKYPGLSPYAYCAWNPVRLVDPDGREIWKPDADGNLIAEKGDNVQTLSKFLNITHSEAQILLENQGYGEGEIIKKGDKIKLDNVYTRSISNTPKGNYRENKTNGYNCWGASISGSQNKEITYGCGIDYGNTFDDILESEYLPVYKEEAVFGKTVIRFADDKNEVQHGAVYYGTSNDGTTYVYTKNGWYEKPTVMKLDVLQKKIPIYGKVQGIINDNSGYYNPKE